ELTGDSWSVFFNLAVFIDLDTLKEPEARGLVVEPVRDWYRVDPPAVDEVVRATGCHPYFTQMVCAKLVEVRNESRLNVMTVAHAREAVAGALRDEGGHIGYAWTEEACTADERLVLAVLARATTEEGPVAAAGVRAALAGEDGVGVGAALDRLRALGV